MSDDTRKVVDELLAGYVFALAAHKPDIAAMLLRAVEALEAAEHRLALATADTERMAVARQLIRAATDFEYREGHTENAVMGEALWELVQDDALDAARSSSLTDTPEGA